MERLQKYLARCGVASRRSSEEIIANGHVTVNGTLVTDMGVKIDPARDKVEVDGELVSPEAGVIYAFNKPAGVTSTMSDEHAVKTIADFFPRSVRVYPVGRLDKYSEGLMLVTNEGDLALELSHPRYEHEKEYEVTVRGKTEVNLPSFGRQFVLDGYRTKPMKILEMKPIRKDHWLVRLVLREGRKRQIRKVAEKLGYQVTDLKRVRIGKLELGNLAPGKWREVDRKDII